MPDQVTGRLDGKVAVVTGGAVGIGAEIGRVLAGRGADVVLLDVRQHDRDPQLVG